MQRNGRGRRRERRFGDTRATRKSQSTSPWLDAKWGSPKSKNGGSNTQKEKQETAASTRPKRIDHGLASTFPCYLLPLRPASSRRMTDYSDLHYPNLVSCRVALKGTAASSKPPVAPLPPDCLVAPPPRRDAYDFSLGKTLFVYQCGGTIEWYSASLCMDICL